MFAVALALAGCAKKGGTQADATNCVQGTPSKTAGSDGSALVFVPDPESSSGSDHLSPSSVKLDDYRTEVTLSRLGGRGVLEGQYVDVRNGLGCDEGFGAYDSANKFNYTHADSRFQEAMAYYFGDIYRARIDEIGELLNPTPVKIIAHCMVDDNAFYYRSRVNGNIVGNVCLGDSYYTQGASYADDAEVTVHELEHASTTDAYDLRQSLNRLWYDEAGAMNEAVSDFMALAFIEPMLPASFDPRTFSRWALGNFIPNSSNWRGAQKCPTYDPQFKNECSNFPAFNGATGTVSYVYPDGLGWPYANNFDGPNYAANAFATYRSQEEIHNAGVLLEGALWDVYAAVRASRGGDSHAAHAAVGRLVLESVKHLSKPSEATNQVSPVTFRELGQWMSDLSSDPTLGFSAAEQSGITSALTARGLVGGAQLPSGWADIGAGSAEAAGVKILDNPVKLKRWLSGMGGDASIVTQGVSTGLNGQLDPGEVVAIWFDVANTSAQTAGGIRITVSTPDADAITVLDDTANIGATLPGVAQIMYGKIYGSTASSQLNPAIPAGTSYFKTNTSFGLTYTTAIWIRVSPTAAHGRTVKFHLDLLPSNGPAQALDFPVKVN